MFLSREIDKKLCQIYTKIQLSAYTPFHFSFTVHLSFSPFGTKTEKLNFNKKLEWGGGGTTARYFFFIDVDVDHLTCCFLYFFCFRFLLNRFNVKGGTAHI